jgi:hypothetical protein
VNTSLPDDDDADESTHASTTPSAAQPSGEAKAIKRPKRKSNGTDASKWPRGVTAKPSSSALGTTTEAAAAVAAVAGGRR